MSLADFFWVYGPMLGYTAFILVVLIALFLVFGRKLSPSTISIYLAILVVGFALLVGGLVNAVMGALKNGIYATGEVVSGGGLSTQIRVNVRNQQMDVSLRSRYSYQHGSRLDVMVDPEQKKVLLVLGPAA